LKPCTRDAATYILIGGAAGGTKSRGLREIGHQEALKHPNFRVLLLRRTYKELDQTHLRDVELEAPQMGADAVPSAKVVRYPNGSVMQFGHCETAADAANYLSAEYDLIIFDELVTFEETMFLLISSRARSTKPGVRPRILAGTNPGGPQSHWVRMRFIDKNVDLEQYPDYRPEEWLFIPSKLEDNPYLDQQYERKLLSLPPELRKAYRDGDWDIFPGQYFPEWRRKTHVSHDANGDEAHVDYPADMARVLSVDWGFVKPGVCGWWVQDPEGRLYREDEYVFTRTTAFEVGKEIGLRCKARGLQRLKYLVFDTAMEIPNNDTGESTIASLMRGIRSVGVSIAHRQADKDRLNGWQRLRHWFRMAPDGKPWMMSSPHCTYFNRTIPSLVSDANKPEDVDTDGEDHAGDDARYMAMSMPLPGSTSKITAVPEFSLRGLMARQKPLGSLGGREVRVA
jgi:phage terminase large subunit